MVNRGLVQTFGVDWHTVHSWGLAQGQAAEPQNCGDYHTVFSDVNMRDGGLWMHQDICQSARLG